MIKARFSYKGICFKIYADKDDYFGHTYRAIFKDKVVWGMDLPTLRLQIKEYIDRVLIYQQ